jgi:D-glycerate 3-kinase
MAPDALDCILDHIHDNLRQQPQRPLFFALQGPQGSGKTFLTEHTAAALRRASLRVATLSIDDLYLPHAGLAALAAAHPTNGLLRGRGQPGTHDVPLGARVLRDLRRINDAGRGHEPAAVRLPAFDKSRFGGAGDRVPEERWAAAAPPLDVVVLEGWCVGFYPQARAAVARRMDEVPRGLDGVFDMRAYALADVMQVNELLAQYVGWWEMVNVFVQVRGCVLFPVCGARALRRVPRRSRRRRAARTCTYTSGACSRSTR